MMNIANSNLEIDASHGDLRERLTTMDLQSMKRLRKELDLAIAGHEERKRREAIQAVEQAAREHGFKLGELLGDRKPGKDGKDSRDGKGGVAKYVNPDNPTQTWVGRGRRPDWIRTALQAGYSLDDMAP